METWHKISDEEKEKIKNQAKKLMEDFGSKLEKINFDEECFQENQGLREEGEPWENNEEFRSTMFSNAPFVDDDLIIAEKGEWKK
ncbi:MAG: hypothetical protein ACOYT4_02905 [Nanoarchaeota archaeon]